ERLLAEEECHRQWPRLAEVQARLRALEWIVGTLFEVRLGTPGLDRAGGFVPSVSAKARERPGDPARARVQRGQREPCVVGIPLAGRPEGLGVIRRLGLVGDRLDPRANRALVPRRFRQRLEHLGLVQHAYSLRTAS